MVRRRTKKRAGKTGLAIQPRTLRLAYSASQLGIPENAVGTLAALPSRRGKKKPFRHRSYVQTVLSSRKAGPYLFSQKRETVFSWPEKKNTTE